MKAASSSPTAKRMAGCTSGRLIAVAMKRWLHAGPWIPPGLNQERYMALPHDNVDGYKQGSAINFAAGLKGHLLIVHGSGNGNVHYQETELLVNKLIELGNLSTS